MEKEKIREKLEKLFEVQEEFFRLRNEFCDEIEKTEKPIHLSYVIGSLDGYGMDSVEESMQELENEMKRFGMKWGEKNLSDMSEEELKQKVEDILQEDTTANAFRTLKRMGLNNQKLIDLGFDLTQIALPDRSITQEEMFCNGYTWNGMLPIRGKDAWQISESFCVEIYRLYEDDTESCVTDYTDFCNKGGEDGLYGVQVEDWEEVVNIRMNIDVKEWEGNSLE